jgi:hypothetical protein
LVSAFVDQKPTIGVDVVDAVAKDFDLSDNNASSAMAAATPQPAAGAEKFDLVDALRTLATLADRLRQSEQDLSKERKS